MSFEDDNEILDGAEEIAVFLFGNSTATKRRRVYRLSEDGVLPVFKMGRKISARKGTLRHYLKRLEEGAGIITTEAAE